MNRCTLATWPDAFGSYSTFPELGSYMPPDLERTAEGLRDAFKTYRIFLAMLIDGGRMNVLRRLGFSG
jgi:hypothetical protein